MNATGFFFYPHAFFSEISYNWIFFLNLKQVQFWMFLQFVNEFLALFLCQINVLRIFHIVDFFSTNTGPNFTFGLAYICKEYLKNSKRSCTRFVLVFFLRRYNLIRIFFSPH